MFTNQEDRFSHVQAQLVMDSAIEGVQWQKCYSMLIRAIAFSNSLPVSNQTYM